MSSELIIENCKLDKFTQILKSKKEYNELISQMELKERILDWKPTNIIEENLKNKIIEKALVKLGSGTLKTTSYILEEGDGYVVAYISYGGRELLLTRQGRKNDMGGYFRLSQEGNNLKITMMTPLERHKARYLICVLIGFLFLVLPGVILGLYYFFDHRLTLKNMRSNIIPAIRTSIT